MNQLIFNLERGITSRASATLPSLVKIVSAMAPPRGGEIYVSRAFLLFLLLFLFFIFLETLTAYTRELMLTPNSPKDADWLKKVLFQQGFFDFSLSGGNFPKKPNISLQLGKSQAKRKFRITSNPFKFGHKLPLTTNRKLWSLFQNPSWKIAWNAP